MRTRSLTACALCALPLAAWAVSGPAPSLDRVTLAPDGQTLLLDLSNAGTDPSGLDVRLGSASYLGGGSTQAAAVKMSPGAGSGAARLRLAGFARAAGAFSVAKSHFEAPSPDVGPQKVDDGASNVLKVRLGADVALKSVLLRQDAALAAGVAGDVVVLKPNVLIPPPPAADAVPSGVSVYGLRVNGADVVLTAADGPVTPGTYAVSGDAVTFAASNVSQRVNTATLLVDGLPAGSFSWRREAGWLRSAKRVELQNDVGSPSLRVFLEKSADMPALSTLQVLMDGGALDPSQVGASGDELVVSLPLSRFAPGAKSALFQVRDPVSGLVSAVVPVVWEKFFRFQIPSVTVTVLGSEAVFRIPNEPGTTFAFGQAGTFSVKLNGLEYGPQGTSEDVLDASGAVLRDGNGVALTRMVRKTPVTLGAGYVEFRLPATVLLDANALIWRNGTLGWETPSYAFDRSGRPTAAPASAPAPEKAAFAPAAAVDTALGFVNQDVATLKIGTLSLQNLDPAAAYELSFSVASDAAFNPFASFTYAGESLETSVENGKETFRYFRRAKGADLAAAGEFAWTPSGVRSQTPVALALKDVTLKKAGDDSQYAPLLSIASAGSASVRWTYDFGTCWDGGTQACEAAGLKDPSLSVASAVSAGGSAAALPAAKPASSVPAPAPVANAQTDVAAASAAANGTELPLTRVQRTRALSTVSKLAAAIERISQGSPVRAQKNGLGLAAAIEARLPQVADPVQRAFLRAVASQLRAKFK